MNEVAKLTSKKLKSVGVVVGVILILLAVAIYYITSRALVVEREDTVPEPILVWFDEHFDDFQNIEWLEANGYSLLYDDMYGCNYTLDGKHKGHIDMPYMSVVIDNPDSFRNASSLKTSGKLEMCYADTIFDAWVKQSDPMGYDYRYTLKNENNGEVYVRIIFGNELPENHRLIIEQFCDLL